MHAYMAAPVTMRLVAGLGLHAEGSHFRPRCLAYCNPLACPENLGSEIPQTAENPLIQLSLHCFGTVSPLEFARYR